MRRWIAPLVILVIALAGAIWYQQQTKSARTGFPAPDFALQDLNGKTLRLSNFRGKVVLLNIWATWCAPCREEMPSMEALSHRLAGKDFTVLAVSQDEDGLKAVKPFVQQFGLTFPVLIDSRGEVGQMFGITGYPETFIIDKEGKVLAHYIGFHDWTDGNTQADLQRLIAARQDGSPPA